MSSREQARRDRAKRAAQERLNRVVSRWWHQRQATANVEKCWNEWTRGVPDSRKLLVPDSCSLAALPGSAGMLRLARCLVLLEKQRSSGDSLNLKITLFLRLWNAALTQKRVTTSWLLVGVEGAGIVGEGCGDFECPGPIRTGNRVLSIIFAHHHRLLGLNPPGYTPVGFFAAFLLKLFAGFTTDSTTVAALCYRHYHMPFAAEETLRFLGAHPQLWQPARPALPPPPPLLVKCCQKLAGLAAAYAPLAFLKHILGKEWSPWLAAGTRGPVARWGDLSSQLAVPGGMPAAHPMQGTPALCSACALPAAAAAAPAHLRFSARFWWPLLRVSDFSEITPAESVAAAAGVLDLSCVAFDNAERDAFRPDRPADEDSASDEDDTRGGGESSFGDAWIQLVNSLLSLFPPRSVVNALFARQPGVEHVLRRMHGNELAIPERLAGAQGARSRFVTRYDLFYDVTRSKRPPPPPSKEERRRKRDLRRAARDKDRLEALEGMKRQQERQAEDDAADAEKLSEAAHRRTAERGALEVEERLARDGLAQAQRRAFSAELRPSLEELCAFGRGVKRDVEGKARALTEFLLEEARGRGLIVSDEAAAGGKLDSLVAKDRRARVQWRVRWDGVQPEEARDRVGLERSHRAVLGAAFTKLETALRSGLRAQEHAARKQVVIQLSEAYFWLPLRALLDPEAVAERATFWRQHRGYG